MINIERFIKISNYNNRNILLVIILNRIHNNLLEFAIYKIRLVSIWPMLPIASL